MDGNCSVICDQSLDSIHGNPYCCDSDPINKLAQPYKYMTWSHMSETNNPSSSLQSAVTYSGSPINPTCGLAELLPGSFRAASFNLYHLMACWQGTNVVKEYHQGFDSFQGTPCCQWGAQIPLLAWLRNDFPQDSCGILVDHSWHTNFPWHSGWKWMPWGMSKALCNFMCPGILSTIF